MLGHGDLTAQPPSPTLGPVPIPRPAGLPRFPLRVRVSVLPLQPHRPHRRAQAKGSAVLVLVASPNPWRAFGKPRFLGPSPYLPSMTYPRTGSVVRGKKTNLKTHLLAHTNRCASLILTPRSAAALEEQSVCGGVDPARESQRAGDIGVPATQILVALTKQPAR